MTRALTGGDKKNMSRQNDSREMTHSFRNSFFAFRANKQRSFFSHNRSGEALLRSSSYSEANCLPFVYKYIPAGFGS